MADKPLDENTEKYANLQPNPPPAVKAPDKAKMRYIRTIEGKIVHLWTKALASHPDMVECDKDGNIVDPPEGSKEQHNPTCVNCSNFAPKATK